MDGLRNRPLAESYPFLTEGATYFKVRENRRVTAPPAEKPAGPSITLKGLISIFPNEKSLMRTMGIVLVDEGHRNQTGRAVFSPKTLTKFMTPEALGTLSEIANEHGADATELLLKHGAKGDTGKAISNRLCVQQPATEAGERRERPENLQAIPNATGKRKLSLFHRVGM